MRTADDEDANPNLTKKPSFETSENSLSKHNSNLEREGSNHGSKATQALHGSSLARPSVLLDPSPLDLKRKSEQLQAEGEQLQAEQPESKLETIKNINE